MREQTVFFLLSCDRVDFFSPGEVFESSTAESSPAPSANGAPEGKMVTPTPTRPRTTEDLFAVIHRYKRSPCVPCVFFFPEYYGNF